MKDLTEISLACVESPSPYPEEVRHRDDTLAGDRDETAVVSRAGYI